LRRQNITTPIVLVLITDPVGQGFVESLAHPGGNITGFTDYDPPMVSKWLRMLTQIIPPVTRVAVLFNPTTAPFAGLMLRVIEESAPSLAVAVRAAPCHDDAEIEAMMTGLAREAGAGLLVLPENFVIVHRQAIITLAARYRLPAVYPYRFFTTSGGLMSYGIDPNELFRRAIHCHGVTTGIRRWPVEPQRSLRCHFAFMSASIIFFVILPPSLAAQSHDWHRDFRTQKDVLRVYRALSRGSKVSRDIYRQGF
jgi:putative tryptophan/tyrosine transport system substrate-binding protein